MRKDRNFSLHVKIMLKNLKQFNRKLFFHKILPLRRSFWLLVLFKLLKIISFQFFIEALQHQIRRAHTIHVFLRNSIVHVSCHKFLYFRRNAKLSCLTLEEKMFYNVLRCNSMFIIVTYFLRPLMIAHDPWHHACIYVYILFSL